MTEEVVHSVKGASSAHRWMECPGSSGLITTLGLQSTASTFAAEGTFAHDLAARCLQQNRDAWEMAGETDGTHTCDAEMVAAIELYLNTVRTKYDEATLCSREAKLLVEARIGDDSVGRDFFGTVDAAVVAAYHLDVIDFKYGAGIAVSATDNPQLKYYACGILLQHPELVANNAKVVLTIVQPRAAHAEGFVRSWSIMAVGLMEWLEKELKPAMQSTADTLVYGEHCRFCPAKVVCPKLQELFNVAAQPAKATTAGALSDGRLAQEMKKIAVVKMYIRAIEDETYRRLNAGLPVEGYKLVPKIANRVFRDGAEAEAITLFGDQAYAPRNLLSPAQLDKVVGGKQFTKEWAYSPTTGLTVAPVDDSRAAVRVDKPSAVFDVSAILKENAA